MQGPVSVHFFCHNFIFLLVVGYRSLLTMTPLIFNETNSTTWIYYRDDNSQSSGGRFCRLKTFSGR